jgi:hypothetical protein
MDAEVRKTRKEKIRADYNKNGKEMRNEELRGVDIKFSSQVSRMVFLFPPAQADPTRYDGLLYIYPYERG